jgi:hypothetical protein
MREGTNDLLSLGDLHTALAVHFGLKFFGFVEFLQGILVVLVFEEDDTDLSLDLDDFLIVGSVDVRVDGPNLDD